MLPTRMCVILHVEVGRLAPLDAPQCFPPSSPYHKQSPHISAVPVNVQDRNKNGVHVAVDVGIGMGISPHTASQPMCHNHLLSLRRNSYLPSLRLHADAPGSHARDIDLLVGRHLYDTGVIGQIEMLVHGVVMLLWRLT
jgi:hypothetical protein